MYEDFHIRDRWTGQEVHVECKAVIAAIATRHADAIDVKFMVGNRAVWVALPHVAWVEYEKRTGNIITDALAKEMAGHYLKDAMENGLDSGREIATLTVEEALGHLKAVLEELAA